MESSTTSTASFSVGVEVESSAASVSMEAGGSIDKTKSTSTEESESTTLKSRIEDTCLLLINSKKVSESGLLEGVVVNLEKLKTVFESSIIDYLLFET